MAEAQGLTVTEKDKQILKSIVPLLIVVALFIFAGKFAIGQIKNVSTQIKEAKKTQSVLSEKLKTLRSVSLVSASGSTAAIIALPKSNPSLQIISQIRNLASMNLLLIEGIRASVSESDIGQMSYVTTSFNLVGPREAISAFVKGIEGIAPMSFVDKLSLVEDGSGGTAASVTVKTYFAPLPSTIPTVTQSVTDLTASEKELLKQISSLTQPVIDTGIVATVSGANPNPFGI